MAEIKDRLPVTLLVLRILVFGVFLMWTLEKFVNPDRAAGIYRMAYSMQPDSILIVLLGILEFAVIVAFLVGFQKRWARAALLAAMGIATLAPARFYPTPFDDHILLYYAAFPTLAVVFALYALRDYDTLWIVGASKPTASVTTVSDSDSRVPLCLLLIRMGVFLVLFMWNMDKFFHPLQTSRIFAGFYNIGGQDAFLGLSQLSYEVVYVIGALQVPLLLAFLFGIAKRFVYGAVFVLHTISTLAPWDRFLSPFSSHTLLFLASFTMLGGCFALYYLRKHDVLWTFSGPRSMPSWRGKPVGGDVQATMFSKASSKVAAAGALLAAFYVLGANAVQWSYERSRGPALLAELQQRYTPSDLLLELEPELRSTEWTAMWRSANCTFSNPGIETCWELHFIVWVPSEPGNVMRGRRQVEAAWIVDADALEFRPDRNATRFFVATPAGN
jgi:uncharacterized membrane protein YphA (DoxX/SURF4 family)